MLYLEDELNKIASYVLNSYYYSGQEESERSSVWVIFSRSFPHLRVSNALLNKAVQLFGMVSSVWFETVHLVPKCIRYHQAIIGEVNIIKYKSISYYRRCNTLFLSTFLLIIHISNFLSIISVTTKIQYYCKCNWRTKKLINQLTLMITTTSVHPGTSQHLRRNSS